MHLFFHVFNWLWEAAVADATSLEKNQTYILQIKIKRNQEKYLAMVQLGYDEMQLFLLERRSCQL